MTGLATVGAKCSISLGDVLALFVGLALSQLYELLAAACEFLELWRRDAERLPDSFDSINLSSCSKIMSCFASLRRSR